MKKRTKTKLVIATDVRFWHASTGAERRIQSIVNYLSKQQMQVIVLFIGALDDPNRHYPLSQQRQIIAEQGLDVRSLLEDWHPTGWLSRLVWKSKCIANWLFQKISSRPPEHQNQPDNKTKYLQNFACPLWTERFQSMVDRIEPAAVIIEYVTLGYLVPKTNRGSRPHYLVDTHDLLSERHRQFQLHNFDHWIRITPEEETEVLQKFDTVIAIQNEEQATFQKMVQSEAKVIVAGYPTHVEDPISLKKTLSAEYTLGYFGSDNPSNTQAITWFLQQVWPKLVASHPQATMLIAGTVCNSLQTATATANVNFQHQVEDIKPLYEKFRIAINPVQFGTGLKIKNQEALAFGKPLIVSRQGAAGMHLPVGAAPFIVADGAEAMLQAILRWVTDETALATAAQAATPYVDEYLTPDHVYAELNQCLQALPVTNS